MSISRVVIPPTPGVFSARGMLTMDISHTFARTFPRSMGDLDIRELATIYKEMEDRGREMLRKERIPDENMAFIRSLDMAYEGQGHYVEVPVSGGLMEKDSGKTIIDAFHDLHEKRYGHRMEGIPKTINVRMNAVGKIKEIPVKKNRRTKEIPEAAFKEKREVFSGGRLEKWTILDRYKLLAGNSMEGPLIVEEPHHITVVLPNQKFTVDRFRNLVIEIGKEV